LRKKNSRNEGEYFESGKCYIIPEYIYIIHTFSPAGAGL